MITVHYDDNKWISISADQFIQFQMVIRPLNQPGTYVRVELIKYDPSNPTIYAVSATVVKKNTNMKPPWQIIGDFPVKKIHVVITNKKIKKQSNNIDE